MPDLIVTYRPTAELTPYQRNARTHTPAQIEQIAASIREFGWTNPVLVDESGGIIAGHGRVAAASLLGMAVVPTICLAGLSESQRRALVIADNKLALNAGWDSVLLSSELATLSADDFDLGVIGFSADELERLLPSSSVDGLTEADETPEPPDEPTSVAGDVWLLGKHRVMCGDSTSDTAVATLMAGQTAALLHADPPYGMGKAADGVANDNLYGADLDRFQMQWWQAFRPFLDNNGSAYIWGNAPELWRLWYVGGLADSEELDLGNEIVWDKKSTPGMGSDLNIGYQTASERCLFFKLGKQYVGNINADDFPEHWEPLRARLEAEAQAAGIKPDDIKRVCGCGMYSHWFSRSQFTLIPEKHYRRLALAYPGFFARPWSELYAEWARVRGFGRGVINGKLDGMRSYFDNGHDAMRDVWEFPRVIGEERHGHATPKPVAMMARVMKSSLPVGGLCVEPFGGSGSTLMGAETTGRVCFTMELNPSYVDVIVRRWQNFTGKHAVHEGTGMSFGKLAEHRQLVAA
jgi:DNA modification methylase